MTEYRPHRPRWTEKLFFFFAGLIISSPFPFLVNSSLSIYLNEYYPHIGLVILSVLVGPFIEELAKAYPLFYRHGETQKSLMTLGFFTGLGFGITEFLFYIFILHAAVYIRILPIIFHVANTMITAFGIGHGQPLRYFLLAVFLHAFYNFSILNPEIGPLGSFGAMIFSFLAAWFLFAKSQEKPIKESY